MEDLQLQRDTNMINEKNNNNDNNKLKDIICNICKEKCFIKIKDYTFNFYGCKNNHITEHILFNMFEGTQKIQNKEKVESQCVLKDR